jgi:hypothetical protein
MQPGEPPQAKPPQAHEAHEHVRPDAPSTATVAAAAITSTVVEWRRYFPVRLS